MKMKDLHAMIEEGIDISMKSTTCTMPYLEQFIKNFEKRAARQLLYEDLLPIQLELPLNPTYGT